MNCANCGIAFGDGVGRMESVLSTWELKSAGSMSKLLTTVPADLPQAEDGQLILPTTTTTQEELLLSELGDIPVEKGTRTRTNQSRISIMSALSRIFEMSPLRLKQDGIEAKEEDEIVNVNVFKNAGEHDTAFPFCSNCGECFTLLYNSFRKFVEILRVEGELGKKLKELEERRARINPPLQVGSSDQEPLSLGRKKRGRPKKIQSKEGEEEIPIDGEDVLKTSTLSKKGRGRRKKRHLDLQQSSASASDNDVEMKEHFSFVVKPEAMDDDSENDADEEFPNYKRVDVDEDDSTPPDSPINLDPEPRPRSPRPVRQSSARNKDWASYYKDEDEEEEEEEVEPLPGTDDKHGADPLGAGNETEVTATEAELDDDDDDEVPPPVEDILGKVEVAWKEGFDDDSDEDYAPDSDLENLIAQGSKSTKAGKRKKFIKRTSSSLRRVYECDTCGKLYAHLESLQIHHRTHLLDNEGLYPCEICYKDFSCDELLKRHRRQFHGEYIPYRMKSNDVDFEALLEQAKKHECPICHELFPRSDIQTHVSEHKVENPWQCPLCPRSLSTLSDFTRHKVLFHHQRPKFSCDVCHKNEFRSLYHLRNHQAAIHNVSSNKQLDATSSSSDTEDNQNLHDGDGENAENKACPPKRRKSHKCTECGKKYFRIEQLTEHLIIHGIGDKFKCIICAREFTHDSSRKRHMLLHADTQQYKCMEEHCDKSFSRKDHLTRHMDSIHGIQVTHEDIVAFYNLVLPTKTPKAKEIPCPYCNKLVKRERMRLHLVSHTGEKKHLCKQCGLKFGLRTTLRTHIQCVHQDIRRYSCSFCNRGFKRSNHLKDHLKLHTDADNKPFQCGQCTKSFRREKNLKSHMVTHYGGKDFMCEVCGKSFNRMDNMKAHVKAVHEGIQIRKKKPPSGKNQGSKRKKTQQMSFEIPVENVKVEDEGVASDQPPASTVPSSTGQDTNLPGSSVITRTPSKKPYQRKRGNKAKTPRSNPPLEEGEIETETLPSMEVQIPPPGTIVTLAVDPTMGNVISADALAGLGAVQIEEIHGTVDGEGESFEHDGQRTTILQLAPGQVFPATSGQYETTYYQYTYYHQE